MLSHIWAKYDNNFSYIFSDFCHYFIFILEMIEIKKNSKDIGPNAPKFHFQYKQWLKH